MWRCCCWRGFRWGWIGRGCGAGRRRCSGGVGRGRWDPLSLGGLVGWSGWRFELRAVGRRSGRVDCGGGFGKGVGGF